MSSTTAQPVDAASELIHQALIYDTDRAFLSATTAFCLDGLARDDRVLAVTTEANIELLRAGLGGVADRVEFVDAREWYDAPGRTLAAYDAYVNTHSPAHRRIRVIGEPVWHGRDERQEAEWTRYEAMLNVAFAGSPAWIVCPYDTRTLPGRVVADARRTHPDLLVGGDSRASPEYGDPAAFTHSADRRPLPPPPAGTAATVRFDADLSLMRRWVSAWAVTAGLPDGQIDKLLLAVNEVATNAVEHGGGHGEIRLWTDGPAVGCDVTDPGHMDTPFPGYLPPDPTGPRGHGMWVVRQVCDLVEIRAGRPGTQVRLHLSGA
ncbi:anti-sigma factor RsbA family regulatory protein [Streptosporangium sp. NPDC002721]|uniref:anti-sigma factor RsbA family regulatory protein n=1 Tax=Streptosporangium sp. NPDC002721 TaxID=3366188 RepID=UPI00369DEAA2